MSKRLYKIIEIIGFLIIFLIGFKVFPYIKNIFLLLFKISLPFLISFVIAFSFEPLIARLELKKINRKVTIFVIVVLFIIFIYLFIKFIIPNFLIQLEKLLKMLPDYLNRIGEFIDAINKKLNRLSINFTIDYSKIENYLVGKIGENVSKISTFLQKIFSYTITIITAPILAIYFMIDYKKIEEKIKCFLMNKEKMHIYKMLSKIKESTRQYIKGVLLVMVIFILVSSFVFLLIGVDYAFLFGIIIGVTDIIPYLGPYLGGSIVVLLTFISNPHKALFVLLSIVILQFIESNFLVPKIQSKTMETSPIIVIFSVILFGELFGILGMIIAVPLEKIVEIIIRTYLEYKKI